MDASLASSPKWGKLLGEMGEQKGHKICVRASSEAASSQFLVRETPGHVAGCAAELKGNCSCLLCCIHIRSQNAPR